MELRILRYFVAVVDHGSITAASRALRVAQPSLSRQLRAFEERLQLALFDRSSRAVTLTAAGRSLLPIARDLIARSERASVSMQQMASGDATRLTLVAAPATVSDLVAPYIVRSGHDGLIVNVIEQSPEKVYDNVATGAADLAIGTRVPPSDLPSKVIGHAYLWAQCAKDSPLASLTSISLAELVKWPLIVMSNDQGVRRMFDDAITRAGLSYQPAFETASTHVAQALAAAGKGVCILSDDSRYGLHSMPIDAEAGQMKITLYGAWDPLHFSQSSIHSTMDGFADFIEELYGAQPLAIDSHA
ncbi:transcriptional regulator, LysR family protein [marine actinobacterium PHSC20C1]|nr:transcriptional regulator, LysR family protein [marine actinobacterium PHSC20C1]